MGPLLFAQTLALATIGPRAESPNVPFEIVRAVEHVESRGDPRAVSSAGCVGLMQVCPRWSAVPRHLLFDPAVNRAEGARLLRYWYDRAGGSWARALAAYRCGNGGLRGKCGTRYARATLRLSRTLRTSTDARNRP